MSNEDLLELLRNDDDDAFKYVLKTCYPKMKGLNSLLKNQPAYSLVDYFHEAIIILIENYLPKKDFELNGSICTFLYKIVKSKIAGGYRMYFKGEIERGNLIKELYDNPDELKELIALEDQIKENLDIMHQSLKEVKDDCQQFLEDIFINDMSNEDLQNKFNFSKDYLKVKKSNCLKYVRRHFFELLKLKNTTNH